MIGAALHKRLLALAVGLEDVRAVGILVFDAVDRIGDDTSLVDIYVRRRSDLPRRALGCLFGRSVGRNKWNRRDDG